MTPPTPGGRNQTSIRHIPIHSQTHKANLSSFIPLEENVSITSACNLNLGGMERGEEEVKKQGTKENEIKADLEVDEVSEEEEGEFLTDEEVEEILREEKENEDDENFNSFLTMEELTHHEWLLKKPQPSWESKWNEDFIGSFAYKCDFMILEDTTFIKETGLVYKEEEGTAIFKQGNEKITFKMPRTMKIFEQTRLIGLSIESIPSSTHEDNFGHERTHYYQSLLIGAEYKHDEGDRRGIRHLMRLENEMMYNDGKVT
nr:hypothetical protein [Tanacetum cinerariifolium]